MRCAITRCVEVSGRRSLATAVPSRRRRRGPGGRRRVPPRRGAAAARRRPRRRRAGCARAGRCRAGARSSTPQLACGARRACRDRRVAPAGAAAGARPLRRCALRGRRGDARRCGHGLAAERSRSARRAAAPRRPARGSPRAGRRSRPRRSRSPCRSRPRRARRRSATSSPTPLSQRTIVPCSIASERRGMTISTALTGASPRSVSATRTRSPSPVAGGDRALEHARAPPSTAGSSAPTSAASASGERRDP